MADTVGKHLPELPGVGDHARTSEPLALGACSAEPGMCPLDDPGSFNLGQDADERKHRAADMLAAPSRVRGWRRP